VDKFVWVLDYLVGLGARESEPSTIARGHSYRGESFALN
jgi:hypothetical protein